MELFEKTGILVEEVVACGGIVGKNPLMMQIYADVLNRPIKTAASNQSSALGAAILGAVAAGIWRDAIQGVEQMTCPGSVVYTPHPKHVLAYQPLYEIYQKMMEDFSRNGMMHQLSALRN